MKCHYIGDRVSRAAQPCLFCDVAPGIMVEMGHNEISRRSELCT